MCDIGTLASVFEKENNFLISAHVNPDGDALGSQLALAIALRRLGKKVTLANAHPVPNIYHFLPQWDTIRVKPENILQSDVFVAIECPTLDRLGCMHEHAKMSKVIVNIDHHISNTRFGKYNYVETSAAAVGEQIYDILNFMKFEITFDIAICIYTSILTDTGSFAYANTTHKTHKIASELIKLGVNPTEISQYIYENNSMSKLHLLALTLETLQMSSDGKIAWVILTKDMYEKTKTNFDETDGFINYVRSLAGVKVAILFREEQGKIKVSFRSKDRAIDVNKIALKFGGGGHRQASGCTITGKITDVKNNIIAEVTSSLS